MSKMNHVELDGLAHAAMNGSPENGVTTPPHPIRRVGVVGANATGIGIAMGLLDAGIPVTVFELERASLGEGIATARSAYQDLVVQGRLAATDRDRRMGLLAGTINFHHLKDCDLVIEAVSTELGIKAELFRRLDETVKPGAILITCTSPARVDHLAGHTRRAGEVVGLHLSCPAEAGATWTLIPGKASSGHALATMATLARHLGKGGVVSADWESQAGHESSMQRAEHDAGHWQVDQAVE